MTKETKTVRFRAREESLGRKWNVENELVTVNNQQYSFDTEERQEKFTKALCATEDELKLYKEYRSEWYRRAVTSDPAPMA